MIFPGFVGPSYTTPSINVDNESAFNLYPENAGVRFDRSNQSLAGMAIQPAPFPKASYVYKAAPGTTLFDTIGHGATGSGPIRALMELNDYLYVVAGGFYFVIAPDDSVSSPTPVANDGKPAYLNALTDASGTLQIYLVSGGQGYVDTGGGLALIPGFPTTFAIGGAILDTYGIALDDDGTPNGGKFFFSAPGDLTSWSALDYEQVAVSANKLVAITVDFRQLWVFGTTFTQVFAVTGDTSRPIQPNPSGILQMGISARNSIAKIDNARFWIGKDQNGFSIAIRSTGYEPVRITTHAVEQAWESYSTVTDAVGFAFQIGGHSFIQWNFPTANKSWRYDCSTELWHEVGWFNAATNTQDAHRGQCHAVKQGRHIIGDRETGQLWILSPAYYDDNGVDLVTTRRCPILASENRNNFYDCIELDMETGVGNGGATQPLASPEVQLRWSNDSGHTWSNGLTRSAGRQGEYGHRVRWQRLGVGRNRVFEFSMSAAVPRTFINAYIEMRPGTR